MNNDSLIILTILVLSLAFCGEPDLMDAITDKINLDKSEYSLLCKQVKEIKAKNNHVLKCIEVNNEH